MTTVLDSILAKAGLQIKQNRPAYVYRDDFSGLEYHRVAADDDLDGRKLQEQAMACAWVYSDINLLARKESQAGLHVMAKGAGGELEPVTDHPLEMLLQRPNPLMSGSFLRSYTSMWRNLDGNAYWWLACNAKDELVEIWPLPARDVRPVKTRRGSNDVLAGYFYEPMRKTLPVEMVCHFRLANPFDPLAGLAPLSALRLQVQSDTAMWSWNTNFFDKQNAIPTAIISVPASTSDVDFQRLREQFVERFGGSNRRSAFGRADDLSVEVIGLPQKDMEFLAGIGMNRETIDRVFGIPAGYWAKDASRNVAATAELIVMRDTVQPALDYQAEEVDAQVVDRYYDEDLVVQADNIVPQDRELILQEYEAHKDVMTIDEARESQGKKPLGGALGETLVGLMPALNQTMAMGLPVPEDEPELPEYEMVQETPTEKIWRRDLRTWRKVALKEAAKGRDAGKRQFISDTIPTYTRAQIEAALEGAKTVDQVGAVFERWA
jgi:HK97 family phage portal protein